MTQSIKAQNRQIDSLSTQSFEGLENHYKESLDNSLKEQYAQAYLAKAKIEKNSIKIADGYSFLSILNSHTSLGIKYADSIISLNIDKKNSEYPAKGYLQKGIQLYYLNKNSEALENYLKANKYYAISKNEYGQLSVRHYIGLLKNKIDESGEALSFFRKNLLFFNKKEEQLKHQKQYLKSLFALADSYNRNRLLDSAEIINERGLIESSENKNRYLYPNFLMSFGITKNYKKEYDSAIDSLIKSTQLFENDKTNLAVSNLYIYESFIGMDQKSKAIKYLKKNDSLFKLHPETVFQAKDSYKFLLKYYKENDSKEKYLRIIERLLAVDSIIKIKQKRLGQKIITNYEIPILLAKKEQLISELNKVNSYKKTSIFILVSIASLFLFLFLFFFRKNSANKKKFNDLINKSDNKKKQSKHKNQEILGITTTTTTTTTGLSEELVKDVLHKLLLFEKSNKFIKNHYTLSSLAKELKTNSSYLSKIINSSKQVNFANYLNKLRIEYAIEKLKNNKIFRNYTVQAIAEESGFNKAQSFSTAFQKQTGISITYFIRQAGKGI